MTLAFMSGSSGFGTWFSAACIVAGGPMFAAGLRAWRLRGSLAGLVPRTLTGTERGLVCARGRVELDEPLTSPLSGRPCAGWTLELRGAQTRVGATIECHQEFRLAAGGDAVQVDTEASVWQLPVTGERRFAPGEALPEGTLAGLGAQPEIAWLQRIGVPLCATERALFQGLEAHVVAVAHVRPVAHAIAFGAARTGTDAHAWSIEPAGAPMLELAAREPHNTSLICAGAPDLSAIAPPGWLVFGLVVGPLLSLFGLLQLALAALGSGR